MDPEQNPRGRRAEPQRLGWQDSLGWAVAMFAIGTYWGWFAIAALREGSYGRAALDGLLFVVGVAAGVLVIRRRRRASSDR